jgi:hypothetical protein
VTCRTVFLTYVFPPDESPRAVQIGRLVQHSSLADLHVVCATDDATGDHVHRVPWGTVAKLRHLLRWRTIRSRLLVPDAFRPWARDAARAARALHPAVLVTFGQPMSDHLAGLTLKRRTGVPWIAHLSDPWSDNPFRTDGPVSRALNRRLERRVVRQADRLVFTSAPTVDLVMAKYPAALRAKVRVLPHAFAPAGAPTAARRDGEPVVVRHLGAFYGRRSPAPLLTALAELRRRDPTALADVRVELWGPAETPVESVPEYAALPAGLVTVHGKATYADSLELMRTADLLVVIDAPAALSVFLPSKLVDYVGARRPLLALTPPGAAADVVARAGGWVVAPDRPAEAVDALDNALDGARANRRADWGAPEVVAEHAPHKIARAMDALIAETAAAGG